MTMEQDNFEYRLFKRTRQACINCRRKKVRCSGDRPACTYCARLRQRCSYEDTLRRELPNGAPSRSVLTSTTSKDETLSLSSVETRLGSLEASMHSLEAGMQSLIHLLSGERGPTDEKHVAEGELFLLDHLRGWGSIRGHSEDLSGISASALVSAADLYFKYCHSQPYSLFHEESFRQRLTSQTLPEYLRLAFLATASRFTDLDHFHCPTGPMSACADKAWAVVLRNSTAAVDSAEALSIVQTIHLLCVIDYSDGQCRAAWIKLGLAIRIAQCYRFNVEPDPRLQPEVKEEYRRTFWSIYLLDRLISCGRERPPAMQDRDCRLRLPSGERAFSQCSENRSPTLSQLLGDAPAITTLPAHSHFSLIILMAATLDRVVHYILREDPQVSDAVPWSAASQYSALESTLWRLELNFGMMTPLNSVLGQMLTAEGVVDIRAAGPAIYGRALFHLAGCLLYHPFLLRHRLADTSSRTPPDFLSKTWTSARRHATALTMLQETKSLGCVTVSCFRGYCSMVAGSIHLLFASDSNEEIRVASTQHYEDCRGMLLELSRYWESSRRMVTKLERLYNDRSHYRQSLNYTSSTGEKPKMSALWDSMDNWVPSAGSPSRDHAPIEQVETIRLNPSLDFFDFSSLGPWGAIGSNCEMNFSNNAGFE